MYGMSVREVLGRADMVPFIDGGLDGVTAPDDPLTVRDCLDLMLAGSFPEPTLSLLFNPCFLGCPQLLVLSRRVVVT